MLAQRLKQQIEGWAQEMRERSALLKLAQDGKLTPQALGLYLTSLRLLLSYSEGHLALAADRCVASGRVALAERFRLKAAEEHGHEGWAEADLETLPAALVRDLEPAPGIMRLVELQRRLIDRDPLHYLAYALWTEYHCVLLGDEWVAALACSGYSPEQLTAITKHVEADRAHAARALLELDSLRDEHTDDDAVLASVVEAERVFEGFCEEILQASLRCEHELAG